MLYKFIKEVSKEWYDKVEEFIDKVSDSFDTIPYEEYIPDKDIENFIEKKIPKIEKQLKRLKKENVNLSEKKEILFYLVDKYFKYPHKGTWENKIKEIGDELKNTTKELPDILIEDLWAHINKWKSEYAITPMRGKEEYDKLRGEWKEGLKNLKCKWSEEFEKYPDEYYKEFNRLDVKHNISCFVAFLIILVLFGFISLSILFFSSLLGFLTIESPFYIENPVQIYTLFVLVFIVSFIGRINYALRPYERNRFAILRMINEQREQKFEDNVFGLIAAGNNLYVGDERLVNKFESFVRELYKIQNEKDSDKIEEYKKFFLKNINHLGTSDTTPKKVEETMKNFKKFIEYEDIEPVVGLQMRIKNRIVWFWVHISSTIPP